MTKKIEKRAKDNSSAVPNEDSRASSITAQPEANTE